MFAVAEFSCQKHWITMWNVKLSYCPFYGNAPFNLIFRVVLGVRKTNRLWGRHTARTWTTCWRSPTLWCWRWTWAQRLRVWSATGSCHSWSPQQHWSISVEVRRFVVGLCWCAMKEMQVSPLPLFLPSCLRSGGGSGRSGRSSAGQDDSSGSIRCDLPWTFAEVWTPQLRNACCAKFTFP